MFSAVPCDSYNPGSTVFLVSLNQSLKTIGSKKNPAKKLMEKKQRKTKTKTKTPCLFLNFQLIFFFSR